MLTQTFKRLIPALGVAAVLALLAYVLDNGLGLGMSASTVIGAGYAYVALLVGAPLLLYPLAWRAGEGARVRVLLSLVPAFLWWLTELGVRLRWHGVAEALWLVASPFQFFHLWLMALAMAIADLACRFASPFRTSGKRVLAVIGCLALGLAMVPLSIQPFLQGYRLLFQSELLPIPNSLPGPLDPQSIQPPSDRPPNIVFILSDDHRFDFAGYENHPVVETPSLDRLAREGVHFERAYVTSSLCSPSRASFLTGLYPHHHGVWNNFTPWSNENRTFLEYLKPAGYRTAFIGKWHMPGSLPVLRGVDHFVTFTNMGGQGIYEWCPLVVDGVEEPSRTRYIAKELTDRALEWMGSEPGEPFVLVLSHKSVHAGFTPDEPEQGRYADAPVSLPPGAQPWIHLTNAQYTHLNVDPLDVLIRRYSEAIVSMDRQIGRVLDALDERGLAENTFVIYASDNGYQWGEKGLVDKRWPYETSIRIPFLVRWPGSKVLPGSRDDHIVANIDVAPTLLSLAGIAVPNAMQGRSLLPLLAGDEVHWRDAFLYTYFFEPWYPTPTAQALITDREKLIRYEGLPAELYDLSVDPSEHVDLAKLAAHAPTREKLIERLEALEDEVERGSP